MNRPPSLQKITEQFYRREWQRRPSNGTRTGLQEFDDQLEIPTRALIDDELRDLRETRSALGRLGDCAAGSPEWLDLESLRAHIDLEEQGLTEILHWRTNPVDPVEVAVGSIFALLMRRQPSRPETAEAIRKRLVAIPSFLRASRDCIDDPIALWVVAARPAAQGGIEFLRAAIPPLAEQHPRLRTGLAQAADTAMAALRDYDSWLGTLQTRPLADDPAIGPRALETIVRVSHGLPYSLDEIDAIATREIDRIRAEMTESARTIDPDRSWTEILDRERQLFAAQPHDLLAEYRAATYGLRDRLVADGVLALPPDEICDVLSTPAFLRSVIPSAAYSSPGPLDAIQRGIYFVSDPPLSLPAAEYRANVGQHFGLESTCAHEAYPGHHVQLCWANHASTLARQMAHHIIFMEGWTLYCEQLMVELGYLATPLWRLDCLASQLWRAYRIRIDVGVHTRRMTVREAIDTLKRELGFTELRAETELNWYTQSPGTPMSYLLGKRETVTLREMYHARHPGTSLREFHSWLLRFGSVPQRWLHPFVDAAHDGAARATMVSF